MLTKEANSLGEELAITTLIDIVVEKEGLPGAEVWTDSELRDELVTFLL